MPHKIVAFNVSHGFQGKYWEIGEQTTAQDEDMREDKDGNLLPPPHFRFADGSAKKAKPGAQKSPAAEKPAEKPSEQAPAAKPPKAPKGPKPAK